MPTTGVGAASNVPTGTLAFCTVEPRSPAANANDPEIVSRLLPATVWAPLPSWKAKPDAALPFWDSVMLALSENDVPDAALGACERTTVLGFVTDTT